MAKHIRPQVIIYLAIALTLLNVALTLYLVFSRNGVPTAPGPNGFLGYPHGQLIV